jgi:hypothetical protein
MTAVTFLLLALPALQSPAVSPLTTGARVRVTVRETGGGERVHVGALRSFDSSVLALGTDAGAHYISLPRSFITRVEISRGSRSQARLGALLGGVLGLTGIVLADSVCGQDCNSPKSGVIAAAVGGGVLVGAGVGAMMHREQWESLPWAVGPARSTRFPAGTVVLSLRF